MILNLGSLAFNAETKTPGGTPAWGTELGQGEGHKFIFEDMSDFFTGMVYKSVADIDNVTCPLGKGGNQRNDYDFVIASLFDKVYVNGVIVKDARFLLLIVKELHSIHHTGRRVIKYNPRMTYRGERINEDCYHKMVSAMGLPENAAWFVYEINIKNQDQLHFTAYELGQKPQSYTNTEERKNAFLSKLPKDGKRPHIISTLDGKPLQQIFYGAPGTGKSFAIKKETEGRAVVRTTFHPDSDYSTFVGAYKPTSVDVPVMTIIGKEQVPVVNAKPEKKIVYEFVPQAFLKAYTGAWKNQDEPFFLVIEEINRGNCAQIFGDLFQLLDRNDETGLSDYPISPDEDIQKFLLTDKKFGFAELTEEQKAAIPEEVQSGELLILPKNLFIWATMNTSDQSLFPIDSAFKRRWDWKYIPISEGRDETGKELGYRIKIKGKLYDWWDFLEKMNDKISTTTHSEDKKLGYYFCKTKDGIINAETFVGKVIFYVWNDVFKDFAEEAGNLFKDENGDLLSYDKFYGVGADGKTKVLEDKVALFLEHLGVEPVMETNPDDVEEEEEDAEDAGGVRRGVAHRQLISVSFPDGTKFDISDGLTHFAVYLEAIKKIGLERAEPIAAASKYHRLNRPVISKERFPEIEADRYSYEQVGEYFLIKGMSNDTYINILNLCNEQLNLGISVEYRE